MSAFTAWLYRYLKGNHYMTGEEMERAIEFLLQSQASFEARMSVFEAHQRRTDEQIAETGRQLAEMSRQLTETSHQLATYAQTQSEFIRSTTESITGLAEAQTRTDAKLDKLIGLFEQHIVAGH
jgi:vacuolar-type H+-ATPase subunit I/STV1